MLTLTRTSRRAFPRGLTIRSSGSLFYAGTGLPSRRVRRCRVRRLVAWPLLFSRRLSRRRFSGSVNLALRVERAALRVAQGAAQVPNDVTDADFGELRRHYSDGQIVDIVAVISLFGFLNRFNDTMATELEASPIEASKRFLAPRGLVGR